MRHRLGTYVVAVTHATRDRSTQRHHDDPHTTDHVVSTVIIFVLAVLTTIDLVFQLTHPEQF